MVVRTLESAQPERAWGARARSASPAGWPAGSTAGSQVGSVVAAHKAARVEPGLRSRVAIRLVGSFEVDCDGVPRRAGAVGGKARTLLKLLAVSRGRTVPIDQIVQVLWQGNPPKRPPENVATLVSRLRRVLGAGAVTGGRAGYRLGEPPAVGVDIDAASALVAEAERRLTAGEPDAARVAAEAALEILGSGLALEEEPYAEWAEPARSDAAWLLRRTRHAAATAALRTADPAAARLITQQAVAADPLNEAAHRLLMRAEAATGEPARALMAYERLRAALAAELGTDPDRETRALHLAILRERVPGAASATAPANGWTAALVTAPRPERGTASAPAAGLAPADVGCPEAAARASGTMAGREAEVSRVLRAWSAATSGTPEMVLVAGEAGAGKSRLAAELARIIESAGGSVLRARCYEAERSLFLQPFVDALTPQMTRFTGVVLRRLLGERAADLAAVVPAAAAVLAAASALDAPPEIHAECDKRRRAYEAVAAVLRGLAATKAILLVLDDLHGAGPATLELVHYIARRCERAKLLVLATVRPEEGPEVLHALDGLATRIDLGPLPREAVARLATASGQAEEADRLFRRTRGHPLFVAEMLRGMAAGEPGIPGPLRTAVLARVRRLGERTERLLRAASTLDRAFDPVMLGEMLDLSPCTAAQYCERALTARVLVVTGGRYEFANELIRELLYETTPIPTRLVHRRQKATIRAADHGRYCHVDGRR
jgi:DNA-binding SARP family transcriptional activator/energy-coupling factor transporter ATP-binding protein EcfA2